MASVKKNDKSSKAKAGSSKTGRSPALKAKEKAAAPKKTAATTRARAVSKPASKKTATTKTATKAAASRARSSATRQRTVASTVSSRSPARGGAKASARTTAIKDPKKKAEQVTKTKTASSTAKAASKSAAQKATVKATASKAAATKVAAAKAAPASKAKTAAAKPAVTKPVAKPAAPAKAVKKTPSAVKAPVVTEIAVNEVPAKAEVKLASAKPAKKADQAAVPVKTDPVKAEAAPKKIAVAPATADQTVSTKPAKAEPALKAAELIQLAPKTSADISAEIQSDSGSLNSVAPKLPTADSSVVRPAEPVEAIAKKAEEKTMIGKAPKTSAPTDTAATLDAKPAKPAEVKSEKAASKPAAKAANPGKGFKVAEFIVYPAHGVGEIIAIEEQEVAGFKLELFVISFIKDKMILKVPVTKVATVGMRKLAESGIVKKALDTLMGRARIKRTMWSRRAQEYEAKINSGDLVAIAEVVRDLYRSDAQPEQSYSERQLYEAALDRLAREVGTVQKLTETEALKVIETQLQKGPRRTKADEIEVDLDGTESEDGEIEEAA